MLRESFTQTLTSPDNQDNWAAYFFNLPQCYAVDAWQGTKVESTYQTIDSTSTAQQVFGRGIQPRHSAVGETLAPIGTGLLNAWSYTGAQMAASGGRVFPDGSSVYQAPAGYLAYGEDPNSRSRKRLLGVAFEVVVATPVVYASGTCTVCRVPHSRREESTVCLATTPITAAPYPDNLMNTTVRPIGASSGLGNPIHGSPPVSSVMFEAGPPSTGSDMMKYSGAKQWPAPEGCYCVITYDADANKPDQGSHQALFLENRDNGYVLGGANGDGGVTQGLMVANQTYVHDTAGNGSNTVVSGILRADGTMYLPYLQHAPLNITAALFTGLTKESKLTWNGTVLWEYFPRTHDPDNQKLVLTAFPSASHDPVALSLYADLVDRVPVGVRQADNASGAYFASLIPAAFDVMSDIAHTMPPGSRAARSGEEFQFSVFNNPRIARGRKARVVQKVPNQSLGALAAPVAVARAPRARRQTLPKRFQPSAVAKKVVAKARRATRRR